MVADLRLIMIIFTWHGSIVEINLQHYYIYKGGITSQCLNNCDDGETRDYGELDPSTDDDLLGEKITNKPQKIKNIIHKTLELETPRTKLSMPAMDKTWPRYWKRMCFNAHRCKPSGAGHGNGKRKTSTKVQSQKHITIMKIQHWLHLYTGLLAA